MIFYGDRSMEVFKNDLSKEIKESKQFLIIKSGEAQALLSISKHVISVAKKCVGEANKTPSVDERISILISGLQELVSFTENKSEKTNKEILLLENKIKTLEEVMTLADKSVREEKKMQDPATEQSV